MYRNVLFKRSALTALVVALLLFAPASGFCAVVRWVSPPEKAIVTTSPITIRGFVANPLAGSPKAIVKRPGDLNVFYETTPVFTAGQLFALTVNLAPGRNSVIFEDGVLSLYYQPDPTVKKPWKDSAGYETPVLHSPAAQGCDKCHWVHEKELTLNADLPGMCLKCHEKIIDAKKPAANANHHEKQLSRYCVACHDPHASFNKSLLKTKGDACTGCHKDLTDGSGHEKASPQPCTLCHDPHRSDNAMMLKTSQETLCLSCHGNLRKPDQTQSSLHRPIATEPCSTCHSHHRTEFKAMLKSEPESLCLGCHPKSGDFKGHTKKLGSCIDCHSGHSAPNQLLIKNNVKNFCGTCHDQWYLGEFGHPVSKGIECLQCHNPHKKRESTSALDYCGVCHSMGAEGFTFVHASLPFGKFKQCLLCHRIHSPAVTEKFPALTIGKPHYPINNGGCGTCHTESDGKIVLKRTGSENCVRCHGKTVGTSSVQEPEKIHSPIRQEDCIACHSPHFRSFPHMLLDEQDRVCEFCHGMVTRMGQNRHKALDDKKGCTRCHVPHFSEERPLLHEPQPKICLDCHPGKMPAENDPLAHGAMKEGRCGGCHSPHTSDEKKLIKGSAGETCLGCHPEALKDKNGNPFAKLHGPVGASECTACHYMGHKHKAVGDKFIEEKPAWTVCKECHSDVSDEHIPSIYIYRQARNQNGCLGCHFPHGAANQYLLKD